MTLAVIRNFLRLGAPIKFRPLRLCSVRFLCHRQRSQANCLFRHTRIYLIFFGQPRPRDSCGYPKFSSAWSADQISTAAPLLCSLSLPQAALTGKLPIPPYPHIKFSSSEFYTARTFRGGAFRLIRIHENFATGFGIFTPIKRL